MRTKYFSILLNIIIQYGDLPDSCYFRKEKFIFNFKCFCHCFVKSKATKKKKKFGYEKLLKEFLRRTVYLNLFLEIFRSKRYFRNGLQSHCLSAEIRIICFSYPEYLLSYKMSQEVKFPSNFYIMLYNI